MISICLNYVCLCELWSRAVISTLASMVANPVISLNSEFYFAELFQ